MTVPAEEMAARAAAWAGSDAAARAAVVLGSVAQGTADEESDLDLIVVAEPGQRDGLWERREQISELLLGHPAAWAQEPRWQRPYRYQSWDDDLLELDLTIDEEHVAPWAALAKGFRALVDKAGVEARLRSDLASWQPAEFDAPALDGGTWLWLNYLHGKLRHGEASGAPGD
jgi:predicted nucleotidyltransferase